MINTIMERSSRMKHQAANKYEQIDHPPAAVQECEHRVVFLTAEDVIPIEFVEEFFELAAELGAVVRWEVRS